MIRKYILETGDITNINKINKLIFGDDRVTEKYDTIDIEGLETSLSLWTHPLFKLKEIQEKDLKISLLNFILGFRNRFMNINEIFEDTKDISK